jgi:hypothetical protein
MDSLLEQIIADFQKRPLPQLTRRAAKLPGLSGKIDTVIGMRRTPGSGHVVVLPGQRNLHLQRVNTRLTSTVYSYIFSH